MFNTRHHKGHSFIVLLEACFLISVQRDQIAGLILYYFGICRTEKLPKSIKIAKVFTKLRQINPQKSPKTKNFKKWQIFAKSSNTEFYLVSIELITKKLLEL